MTYMIEEPVEKYGDTIIRSSVREATPEEVAEAERLFHAGECQHKLVTDECCWPYYLRRCALCEHELGTV